MNTIEQKVDGIMYPSKENWKTLELEKKADLLKTHAEQSVGLPINALPDAAWNNLAAISRESAIRSRDIKENALPWEGSHAGDEMKVAAMAMEFARMDGVAEKLMPNGEIRIQTKSGELVITKETLAEDLGILTLLTDIGKSGDKALRNSQEAENSASTILYNDMIMDPETHGDENDKPIYLDMSVSDTLELYLSKVPEKQRHLTNHMESVRGKFSDITTREFWTQRHLDDGHTLTQSPDFDTRTKSLAEVALAHHGSQNKFPKESGITKQSLEDNPGLARIAAILEYMDKRDAFSSRGKNPNAKEDTQTIIKKMLEINGYSEATKKNYGQVMEMPELDQVFEEH